MTAPAHLVNVIEITSEQLGVPIEEISASSTFASLGADELDFVEIVMAAEEAHKVSITDDHLTKTAGIAFDEEFLNRFTIGKFAEALDSAEPQKAAEEGGSVATGTYTQLVSKPLPDGHSLLFIPSLAAMLQKAESTKGQPLTKDDVLRIRDQAPAMVVPNNVILEMKEARKYEDIDPASIWEQWQELRGQFD